MSRSKRFKKIYLEITNVCNLSCSFCAGTSRKKHFLSVDEFEILAKKLRTYTDYLYFHLMGEPLLHPQLNDFLKISEYFGFKVIITTNGTLLGKAAEILLNSPALFKVSISLHSFEANEGGVDMNDYLSGCFDFADEASVKGIITVFRLWNNGGLNELNDGILTDLRERFPEDWEDNNRGIKIRDKLFIEFGKKFDWPLHSSLETERIHCYGMKDQIGVLCNGDVVPCCMDYDGNAVFGNLFENELDEILSSPKAVKFKQDLDSCVAPCKMCRTCGFAQNLKNHINHIN